MVWRGPAVLLGVVASLIASPCVALPTAPQARQLIKAGIAQQAYGQYGAAIRLLSQAINSEALTPADLARAYYDRGVAYDAIHQINMAVADYSAALRCDRNLAPALNNRANAYRRLGNFDKAIQDYESALRVANSATEYPFYGLGLTAQQKGRSDEARNYFRKALAANPAFAPALHGLATLSKSGLQNTIGVHASTAKVAGSNSLTNSVSHASGPTLRGVIREAPKPQDMAATNVQLGAFRNERLAQEGWDKIKSQANGLLDGKAPIIVVADIPGKGRFFRLRTSLIGRASVRQLCEVLASKNAPCLPL